MKAFNHSDEVIKAVCDLYGFKSANDIANEMNLGSRNTVIGIWSRSRSKGLLGAMPIKSLTALKKHPNPYHPAGPRTTGSANTACVDTRKKDPVARRDSVGAAGNREDVEYRHRQVVVVAAGDHPSAAPDFEGFALTDLTHNMCHWPVLEINDVQRHRFCGEAIGPDSTTYCSHHQLRSRTAKRPPVRHASAWRVPGHSVMVRGRA